VRQVTKQESLGLPGGAISHDSPKLMLALKCALLSSLTWGHFYDDADLKIASSWYPLFAFS